MPFWNLCARYQAVAKVPSLLPSSAPLPVSKTPPTRQKPRLGRRPSFGLEYCCLFFLVRAGSVQSEGLGMERRCQLASRLLWCF